MARTQSSYLPEEEIETPPWAALLRARGLAPEAAPVPLVGNASPAEVPGQSAEAYAQAAQAEKAKGNEDAAARLTVRATEAKSQESAAQGTPEPATPLAPVAQAPASAAPKMTMAPSADRGVEPMPWSWAVSRDTSGAPAHSARGDMSSPSLYKPLEEPPAYQPPDKGVSFFALALDALLNKGRNAGRLVGQMAEGDDAYTNYQRRVKAAKDAADIEATKRRGSMSPEEKAYRDARLGLAQENLKLRGEQIAAQGESFELRKEQEAIKNNPNHEIAQRVRANLYSQGVKPGTLDGLSLDAMKSGNNAAIKNLVEQAQSTEMAAVAAEKAAAQARATEGSKIRVAEGISNATQANKLELVAAGQEGKVAAEDRADTREQSRRGEDFMKWYSKETEKDLAIAKLMDRVDKSPGGVPPEFFERFKNAITARGIDPERMESWQAKQMILELWGRQQSGAAIGESEDVRFAKQVGNDPLASPEQVEAAYSVMSDVIGTWLRTKAAARPQEAMTVAQAAGIDTQRWLGGLPVAPTAAPSQQPTRRTRPAQRRPAPAATIPAEDLEF